MYDVIVGWSRITVTAATVGIAACSQIFGLQQPKLEGDAGSGRGTDAGSSVDAPGVLPCTASGLQCSGTTMAMTCGQRCWVSCSEPVDESTAAARCAAWAPSRLAPLQGTTDVGCYGMVIAPAANPWIGLEQSASATMVGSGWSWNSDGQQLSSTNWAPGEPDDGYTGSGAPVETHREDCAMLDGSGYWHDAPCTSTAGFGCRRSSGGGGGGGN